MDFQEIVKVVEEVPGGPYTVLVAAVVGLIGATVLCLAVGRGRSPAVDEAKHASVDEHEEVADYRDKQQPRKKGKLKQQSTKKVSLPQHPLLAAEFKGHTGAVLSLDVDTNGKYLASCSDGEWVGWLHGSVQQSSLWCVFSFK